MLPKIVLHLQSRERVDRKLDRGQVDNNVGGLALAAPCTAAAVAVVL